MKHPVYGYPLKFTYGPGHSKYTPPPWDVETSMPASTHQHRIEQQNYEPKVFLPLAINLLQRTAEFAVWQVYLATSYWVHPTTTIIN